MNVAEPESKGRPAKTPGSEEPGQDVGAVLPLAVVAIAFIIMGLAFGPMILADRRNARILREGVPAKARVTKIVPTGNYHNEQPEVLISLEVTPNEGEPFASKVETYMSPVYLPRFQPGFIVDVRFDAARREDIALVGP